MKRVLLAFLILSLSLSFVIAITYDSDGSYSLNKGDSVTLDNSYRLVLTNVEAIAQSPTNVMAIYSFDIYKGDSKLTSTSFNSYNFATSNYSIEVSGESIAEITFIAGMNPDRSQVTIISLGVSEEQEQQEAGDVYTQNTNNQDVEKPGFFKRSWTWFKCLFSKKC